MFDFLRRPSPRPLSDAIRIAIEKDHTNAPIGNLGDLRMVQVGGRYSDRKVTYFRVFDPATTAQRTRELRRYKDFDLSPGLVVRSGHVEDDGTVILTRPVIVRPLDANVRTRAGRIVPTVAVTDDNGAAIIPTQPTSADVPTAGSAS